MKNGLFLSICLCLAAVPASAQAVSDTAHFADPVIEVAPVRPLRPVEPPKAEAATVEAAAPSSVTDQSDAPSAAGPVSAVPDMLPASLRRAASASLRTPDPAGGTLVANPLRAAFDAAVSRARAVLGYRIDQLDSRSRTIAIVFIAAFVVLLVLVTRGVRAKPAVDSHESETSAPVAASPDRKGARRSNNERSATESRAAVWAARTLAGAGMDAAAIARRTGLARDATLLLVSRTRTNVPGPAASSPSGAVTTARRGIALQP
jgi:hypothetical protein